MTETETAAGTTKSPSFAITENETSPPAEGGGEDPEGEEDSEAVTQDEASVLISERIIRPTLIREAQWCQEHWEDYRDRGLGDSPEELFASLYIRPIDFEYSTTGRTMNRLIEDAVGLYGADYHLLGLYYRNDAEYFTQEVQELIGQ